MKISEAGTFVQKWVDGRAQAMPGLVGAYISGSFLGAGKGDELPESSDVDIVLVFEPGACPPKPGKLRENGLLLEVTCMEAGEFASLDHVLSTHYLAYAMNAGAILFDPRGMLGRLHKDVERQYARREWVQARCGAFYSRITEGVGGYRPESMSLPQTVNGWAFTTAITCFPLLLADLQNCTVRKRYTAARQVLDAYGMEAFYPRLRSLLVPEPLGRERLAAHMRELERTFRMACGTEGPSARYPFRGDITEEGAAVAIGGSWELLDSPHPEDAAFWMLATFARCHIIFDMDAPDLGRERLPALWAFLGDLGIQRVEDFKTRLDALLGFLPALREAADTIIEKREAKSGSRGPRPLADS